MPQYLTDHQYTNSESMKARQKTDKEMRKLDRDYAFVPPEELTDNSYLFKIIFGVLVSFFVGALIGEGCTYIP